MRKILMILALSLVVLSVMLVLTACGEQEKPEPIGTKVEDITAAPTEEQTESPTWDETAAENGAQAENSNVNVEEYLPLDTSSVWKYVKALYNLSYDNITDIVSQDLEDGIVELRYTNTKEGVTYIYRFDKATGKQTAAEQEKATSNAGSSKKKQSSSSNPARKALSACEAYLGNDADRHATNKKVIDPTDGSPIYKVEMTFNGIDFEFEYNATTGEVTQISPK